MTFCPSDQRLVQLLEEQLDRRELVDIEQHLERCDHCQEMLEELTRERFSFVGWNPWSEADPADPEAKRRPKSPQLSGSGPSSTLFSAFGAEPSADSLPEVEGYEVLERIGQGGMGIVYRARQHGLERMVALKMIRDGSHAAPEHLGRFRIEARALARLGHPNVVQIHDIGRSDGVPFVALELLEGGSLDGRVAGTPQPESTSAELAITLARAIAAAHKAGVVHRDLKSANVLFAADGTPKIVDFGLAKRLDEEDGQTQTGQVMGSPSFMAPEQARGRDVGPLADVYSLGAILYEMLTGRPPFKGSSPVETLYQVVNDEPVPPTRLRPGLSRDLETIALKCLSKDPRRRYDSAEGLADDLERYLAGTPILARPIGLRELAWKWARRQPAVATLALVVLATAVILGALGYRHHREARLLEAQAAREDAKLRDKGHQVIDAAQLALRDARYEFGLRQIDGFLAEVAKNPRLADVTDQLQRLVVRLEESKAEQNRKESVQARLEQFRGLRHQAQLRDAQLVSFGEFRDVTGLRQAIHQALGLFGDGDPKTFPEAVPLPNLLAEAEKDEVEQGRYELLLMLSEAVAQPLVGENPHDQATQALAILDRAARHHPSRRAPHAYHLLRADCLARQGDEVAAEAERRAAELVPNTTAFGHLLDGETLRRRQKWGMAIQEFETALRLEPGLFRAQLLLAVCQLQQGKFGQARTNLTACIQREPRAITLYLLRGFASSEEAHLIRQRAAKLGPRTEATPKAAEAQFEAAEADFQQVLTLAPTPAEHYGLLVNRGAMRLRRQRLDEAVSDFLEAIERKPDEVSAYIVLGQAYRQQGKSEAALAQFTRGIALRPEMPTLYRSRALTRLDRGRPTAEARDAALRDLAEAIRLDKPGDPEYAADRSRRARLLLQAGRPGDALADAEDALQADSSDAEAHLIRVKSLLDLKRFDEVIGACDDALSRGRPSAELYELRGLARASRLQYASAIQDYNQSLALDPNRSTPLIQRGWAYLVSEAPSLAILDFDRAIRIAPDEPDAYNGRGFALVFQGLHKEAVENAEAALVRGKDDARTHYNAARIYAKAANAINSGNVRWPQKHLAEGYQDSAQALIRLALEKMPPQDRADFWRSVVEADPALVALRQRPNFSQMAGQYGRLAK